jgi:hypothetical protein
MKYCLIFITVWSLLLFLLSLAIAGIFPFYPANFYEFTLPFMITSFSSSLLAAGALFFKERQKILFAMSLILFALMVVPFGYAVSQWPRGDDGPGMAWQFFIGGGSLLATLVAFLC